jgi:Na+-transporting NADH:ubiquinone oxidoreductase subunit NqrD
MSKQQMSESEYRTKTLLVLAPTLFFMLIGIIGIVKSCVGNGIDTMDDSIIRSREVV